MSDSTIALNVVPLTVEPELRCGFYQKADARQGLSPLNDNEMPRKAEILYNGQTLYTDFKENEDADSTLTIDLNESTRFARHYLNHLFYEWFKGRARLLRQNFVNNTVLYFLKEQDKQQNLSIFDRFVLRGTWGRITGGAELTVMYRGTMKVWNRSILHYDGPTEEFSKVIYDGHVHRYETLMEKGRLNRNELYPVINRNVARRIGLKRPPWKPINKVKRHARKTASFYDKWINEKGFKEAFSPSPEGFKKLKEYEVSRVNHNAANLLFGDGVVEKVPYKGMDKGGPYEPPRTSHIELFIIVDEEDAPSVGNRLYQCLKKGIGHFPGLRAFTQIPVFVSAKNITFSNADDPLPEVTERLRSMDFQDDKRYGAIYISPIDKREQDPKKRRVYYRLKEELLKYNVTSQVINRKSVTDASFAYYLPNIAVALLAKLDGTPWTLEKKQKKELVIGVGAFSPYGFRKTYLGSAFCFSSTGDFRGFDSFTADDHLKLAGSFQKAVRQFRNESEDIDRIVIHFYKIMNKDEARVIKKALRELHLDIPLVVLTIHKTGSNDLVLTDTAAEHCLPKSGIYYRSGYRQFILCNNARFDEGEKLRAHPYPIKVYFDAWNYEDESIKDKLKDAEWVDELIEQVYQFSRLNWQTVSTSNMPVTILYPEMVAEKFPYFESDTIPEFGKRNFWFL